MSRRRQAVKRPLAIDPKYHSPLVSRLVNTVMDSGKKSVAERIVYGAFDRIIEKNPNSPKEYMIERISGTWPFLITSGAQ